MSFFERMKVTDDLKNAFIFWKMQLKAAENLGKNM